MPSTGTIYDWETIKSGARRLHSSANALDSPLRQDLTHEMIGWDANDIWDASDILDRLPYVIESARLHRQLGRDGFEHWCDFGDRDAIWISIQAAILLRDGTLEERGFVPLDDDDMELWVMAKFVTVSVEYTTERYLPDARFWVKMKKVCFYHTLI